IKPRSLPRILFTRIVDCLPRVMARFQVTKKAGNGQCKIAAPSDDSASPGVASTPEFSWPPGQPLANESKSLGVSEASEPPSQSVEMVPLRACRRGLILRRACVGQHDLRWSPRGTQLSRVPEIAGPATSARLDKHPNTLRFAGKVRTRFQ